MKNIAMKIVVCILRIVYIPFRMMPVKNRICFMSRQSDEPSLDIRLLTDCIGRNYPGITCRVLARRLEGSGKISYAFHMLAQMNALATSRVVVLDGYCIVASALPHKRETTVVQMWHALTAVKKFGYQVLDKPAGRNSDVARIMHMHRNYDCILAPSMETGRLFCQAFDSPEEKIALFKLPRVDEVLREDAEFSKRIREEYGIPDEKEMLLYVPTFRRGKNMEFSELVQMAEEEGYKLIVKLHPVFDDGTSNADRKYSSYQWLKACNRVITDYSALGIEAALTGKPVYFFVNDIDEYEKEVGLNINPEREMPTATARTADELRIVLKRKYDFVQEKLFCEKYAGIPDNDCTEKLAEYLVEKARGS